MGTLCMQRERPLHGLRWACMATIQYGCGLPGISACMPHGICACGMACKKVHAEYAAKTRSARHGYIVHAAGAPAAWAALGMHGYYPIWMRPAGHIGLQAAWNLRMWHGMQKSACAKQGKVGYAHPATCCAPNRHTGKLAHWRIGALTGNSPERRGI